MRALRLSYRRARFNFVLGILAGIILTLTFVADAFPR